MSVSSLGISGKILGLSLGREFTSLGKGRPSNIYCISLFFYMSISAQIVQLFMHTNSWTAAKEDVSEEA